MTASESLKIRWIRTVRADDRMSLGVRFVLTNVVMEWTTLDRPTFEIKQTTVAERMNVSVRVVKEAFAAAKRLGYLVVEVPRKRGPGANGPDKHRLVIPAESGAFRAPHSPHSSELGARIDGVRCADRRSEVQGSSELGARIDKKEAAELREPDPYALKEALSQAFVSAPARASAAREPHTPANLDNIVDAEIVPDDPDPEPPRYCSEHPDDTPDSCAACMRARKKHDRWKGRNFGRLLDHLRRGEDAAPTQLSPTPKPRYSCNICNDTDIVLMSGGKPDADPKICLHNGGGRRPMTAAEREQHADLIAQLNGGTTAA